MADIWKRTQVARKISELTRKISELKIFKPQIESSIRDEQEAQRIYDILIVQADRITTMDADMRSLNFNSKIRGIRNQENEHEGKLKLMLQNTEQQIIQSETMLKDEQRKLL